MDVSLVGIELPVRLGCSLCPELVVLGIVHAFEAYLLIIIMISIPLTFFSRSPAQF